MGNSPKFNIYTDSPVKIVEAKYKRTNMPCALDDHIEIAAAYLQRNHGIAPASFRITDAYIDEASGIAHVYAKQVIGEFGVANGLANVNIDRDGHLRASEGIV
ncbi:hypothetical protein GGI23_007683 [Coemansia sp. RSA 2559]|nr:hypothetical protein GGI23_007683 [Coemansia sp. RSA 2559]